MHPEDQATAKEIRYPAHLERMPCSKNALEERDLGMIFSANQWLTGTAKNTSFQVALSFMRNGLELRRTLNSGEVRYKQVCGISERMNQILDIDYNGNILRFYQDCKAKNYLPEGVNLRYLLDYERIDDAGWEELTEVRRKFSEALVREMVEACHGSQQSAAKQYSVPLHIINYWA
jgi:hypothetical protein